MFVYISFDCLSFDLCTFMRFCGKSINSRWHMQNGRHLAPMEVNIFGRTISLSNLIVIALMLAKLWRLGGGGGEGEIRLLQPAINYLCP